MLTAINHVSKTRETEVAFGEIFIKTFFHTSNTFLIKMTEISDFVDEYFESYKEYGKNRLIIKFSVLR